MPVRFLTGTANVDARDEDYSVKEVASRLNISGPAAKSRLYLVLSGTYTVGSVAYRPLQTREPRPQSPVVLKLFQDSLQKRRPGRSI